MSYLISILIMLFLSFTALARNEQFQLKGSYKLESSVDKSINYLLSWSEENGAIQGSYSDNYFTKRATVIGKDSIRGRDFIIEFPVDRRGVKTLTVLASQVENEKGVTTIPVSIIARDAEGNPLTNVTVQSELSATRLVAQKQEEECREGFGAIGGFCGIYEGLIAEMVDRQNKCNLLFADTVKLELDTDGNLTLYLGQIEEIFDTPGHLIGRIPTNPKSTRIDVLSRSCRSLPGIESKSADCKRLNLSGQFTLRGISRHFQGTYSIFDEGSKNTCNYSLSMDQ